MPRKKKRELNTETQVNRNESGKPAFKKTKLSRDQSNDLFESNNHPNVISLDFGDADDVGSGEAQLNINEEYARRFEYNKKRVELQRLQEKYGKKKKKGDESDSESDSLVDGDEDESTDSEEDEFGDLLTEDIEKDFEHTLSAIRSKDPRIYDPKVAFFKPVDEPDDESEEKTEKKKREKPMYLRDYHRQNLLSGKLPGDEDEVEKDKRKTFFQEQDQLKKETVGAMHSIADQTFEVKVEDDDDDDDDDDFLQIKETHEDGKSPEPPNPAMADENPELYLSNFMASRAWIPKDKSTVYGPILESDDSDFDRLAAIYEEAYNFRFEDPKNARQILGHARQTLRQISARRKEDSARKRAREEKRRKKEAEKAEKKKEKARLRALRVEEIMENLKKIKEAAGLVGYEGEHDWKELLRRDFNMKNWEKEMQKIFNDDYYNPKDGAKITKPRWDDDVDIKDLVPDFTDDDNEDENESTKEDNNGDAEVAAEGGISSAQDSKLSLKKKTRKDYQKEQRAKKQEERLTRKEVEKFVNENLDFDEESNGGKKGFRYREVTPESFGLTSLDIFTAEDAQLNQYAGLKKYAPFRDKDKKVKDKKKYKKKRRLQEWRKEVFEDI